LVLKEKRQRLQIKAAVNRSILKEYWGGGGGGYWSICSLMSWVYSCFNEDKSNRYKGWKLSV